MKIRCGWCKDDPIYQDYHDNEWGVPLHDEKSLFELFILETLQAGLSWITVLKKREAYQEALDHFDAKKIARYDDAKLEALMQNSALIRNRLKMNAIVHNAKCYLKLCEQLGGFDPWLWAYVNNTPIINRYQALSDIPVTTALSDQISNDLKKLGFKFVGSISIYAFMQAMGMVNDHVSTCFKYCKE